MWRNLGEGNGELRSHTHMLDELSSSAAEKKKYHFQPTRAKFNALFCVFHSLDSCFRTSGHLHLCSRQLAVPHLNRTGPSDSSPAVLYCFTGQIYVFARAARLRDLLPDRVVVRVLWIVKEYLSLSWKHFRSKEMQTVRAIRTVFQNFPALTGCVPRRAWV